MSDRRGFTIEVKGRRKPNADFASKAGDARRQGRVDHRVERPAGQGHVAIAFVDVSGTVEARLVVVCVARITVDPAAGGFLWACHLPMIEHAARPATDLDRAKGAGEHQVRNWCEAAGVISARQRGGR